MSGFDRYATIGAHGGGVARTRRFSPRAQLTWTVGAAAGPLRLRFHTVDVSALGARLRPRGRLELGTPLRLEFIAPTGEPLPVAGIVWRADADSVTVLFLGTIPTELTGFSGRS